MAYCLIFVYLFGARLLETKNNLIVEVSFSWCERDANEQHPQVYL